MNGLIVIALGLQHCFFTNGTPVLGNQPPSPPVQTADQVMTTVNANDFRQHALDLGNRLSDLLRQEIIFLSKISNIPISDLDRNTIPGIMSSLPSTFSAIQAPPSNQITINTYAGPTTQAGNPNNNGQCTCTPQQYASTQGQACCTPPSNAGIGQQKPGYLPQKTQPQGGVTTLYNQPQPSGSADESTPYTFDIQKPLYVNSHFDKPLSANTQPQLGQTFQPNLNAPSNTPNPSVNDPFVQGPQENPLAYTFDMDKPLMTTTHFENPSSSNTQSQLGQAYTPNPAVPSSGAYSPTTEPLAQQPQEPLPYTFDADKPLMTITHYQNPPATETQTQLGQSSATSQYAPPNAQPSANPSIQQPVVNPTAQQAITPITGNLETQPLQGATNPPVAANPLLQQPQLVTNPILGGANPTVPQPQQSISPPTANPILQQPQLVTNPTLGGANPTVPQPQQSISPPTANPILQQYQQNPPAAANPLFQQPGVMNNPTFSGGNPTVPQLQQTTNPATANPIQQQYQQAMNPPVAPNPLAQQSQPNSNPHSNPLTLQPQEANPTIGANTLGAGQPLQSANVPAPGYQQVVSNPPQTYGAQQTQPNQQTYLPTAAISQPQALPPQQSQPQVFIVEPPKQAAAAPVTV